MNILIGSSLSFVFLLLAGIHFYWALGGKWGSGAVFPTKPGEENPKFPGSLPTFSVAVLLLGISLFYLIQLKVILFPLPEIINNYGLKILSVLFIVRAIGEFNYVGFFKTHKKTKFGQNDTKYYSPLCLLLGLLTLLLDSRLLIG